MKTERNKNARRELYLLSKYGITLSEYDTILKKQGGGCAICGKASEKNGKALAVEHDHVSGFIRGVCCSYCNHRVIGRHRDPILLRRIADYISQHTGFKVPPKKKRKRKPSRRRERRKK